MSTTLSEPRMVERIPLAVAAYPLPDDHETIRLAWIALRAELPALPGREFVGAFDDRRGEYWACAGLAAGEHPPPGGSQTWEIPGGPYVAATLAGSHPEIYDAVAGGFTRLSAGGRRDAGRPLLEIYRARDGIELLVPVR